MWSIYVIVAIWHSRWKASNSTVTRICTKLWNSQRRFAKSTKLTLKKWARRYSNSRGGWTSRTSRTATSTTWLNCARQCSQRPSLERRWKQWGQSVSVKLLLIQSDLNFESSKSGKKSLRRDITREMWTRTVKKMDRAFWSSLPE